MQLLTESSFQSLVAGDVPFLLFKHSKRCSISALVLNRFKPFVDSISEKIPVYMVDVVSQRPYSLAIADRFQVHHESPQVILYTPEKDVVLVASHLEISGEEVLECIND
jgi:bacillithiol system protein YtxJ